MSQIKHVFCNKKIHGGRQIKKIEQTNSNQQKAMGCRQVQAS